MFLREKYRELAEAVAKNLGSFFLLDSRDAVDSGNDLEKAIQGHNCTGQWWCSTGLPNEGGFNGDASRRRTEQFGGGEDAPGAGC